MNGRSIDRRRLHKWRNNHYRKQILSVLKKSNCCGRDLRKDKLQKVEGFPGGSDSKESACSAGDLSSIPGSGRSPGEGHGNPSTVTWRIPWTEEPGELQSTGSQKSRTRLSNKHFHFQRVI